MARTPTKISLK